MPVISRIENLQGVQVHVPLVHTETSQRATISLGPGGAVKKVPLGFDVETKWKLRNPNTVVIQYVPEPAPTPEPAKAKKNSVPDTKE
jgi:hypothetical protein